MDRILTTPAERIEWAGEFLADICEGLVADFDGWLGWNRIVGWTDLCSDDDRRQYLALAGQVATLLSTGIGQ